MLIYQWESEESYVAHWGLDQHLKAIHDPHLINHMIIAKKSNLPVGYAILKINSPDVNSVELIRIVIGNNFKNQGYGTLYFAYISQQLFNIT